MIHSVLFFLLGLVAPALAAAGPLAEGDAVVPSADGVAIHYHVEGAGEPALVFVHGWACDRHYWAAQLPVFAKENRVVALDLGGHGESGVGRKAWTIPAFGDDVRAVVLALGLQRVVLVGHSMGGPVVLDAARKMPDRVVAVIPVDIFVNVERKLTAKERRAFLASLRADFVAKTRDFVRRMFVAGSDPALVSHIAGAMSKARREVAIAAMEGIWEYDVPAALRAVRAPIRCINSDRRGPTDVDMARRHAPQFEAVVLKGAGHFVMIEDAAGFDRLLAQALVELVPAPTIPVE